MADESKFSLSRNYNHHVESDMPSLGGGKSICKLMTVQSLTSNNPNTENRGEDISKNRYLRDPWFE